MVQFVSSTHSCVDLLYACLKTGDAHVGQISPNSWADGRLLIQTSVWICYSGQGILTTPEYVLYKQFCSGTTYKDSDWMIWLRHRISAVSGQKTQKQFVFCIHVKDKDIVFLFKTIFIQLFYVLLRLVDLFWPYAEHLEISRLFLSRTNYLICSSHLRMHTPRRNCNSSVCNSLVLAHWKDAGSLALTHTHTSL